MYKATNTVARKTMSVRDFRLRNLVPLHTVPIRDALFERSIASTLAWRPNSAEPEKIKTVGLRKVAWSLFQNVGRLDETALSMPLFVHMAEHLGKHGQIGMSWGEVRVTAGYVGVRPAGGGEDSEQSVTVNEQAVNDQGIGTFFGRRWDTVTEYLAEFPELANGIGRALHHIETWSPLGDSAIDAWLTSIVTDCWTMFEVLATDLWEEALNCHPHGLTNMGDKTVSIRQLQEYGYDLRANMGTLLKDKLGARGLQDIRFAYKTAFSENRVHIDKAICDDSLLILQSVRNCLVHRAGIVDQRFCDHVNGGKLTTLSSLKIGDRILLDGELVSALVGPAVQCTLDLLLAVDRWLQCH